jgi:hypothetical protein
MKFTVKITAQPSQLTCYDDTKTHTGVVFETNTTSMSLEQNRISKSRHTTCMEELNLPAGFLFLVTEQVLFVEKLWFFKSYKLDPYYSIIYNLVFNNS